MYFFSFPCLKFPIPGNILQKLKASLGLIFCVLVCRKIVFRRVRKIAKRDHELRHVYPSVRMEQLGSHSTDFLKFDICLVFENVS